MNRKLSSVHCVVLSMIFIHQQVVEDAYSPVGGDSSHSSSHVSTLAPDLNIAKCQEKEVGCMYEKKEVCVLGIAEIG